MNERYSSLDGLRALSAIGTSDTILNNRVVMYLSGISIEIYLCHMMCFRAVQFLHIDNYIHNVYVVYWTTCVLTTVIAVVFCHVVKYMVLPRISLVFNKKKDIIR